ncbi:MAG TPA: hypothetical protein VIO32_01265 [Candidatus Baltobacteraceae bacterium]
MKAPTLVPQPLYTPPAVETNGNYRLATIDALNEAPCYLAWNVQRQAHSLTPAVLDEWSTENARAISWVGFQPNGAGQGVQFLTAIDAIVSGGSNCSVNMVLPYWQSAASYYNYVTDPEDAWYGGSYLPYNNQHSATGAADFAVDPRIIPDPSGTPWP